MKSLYKNLGLVLLVVFLAACTGAPAANVEESLPQDAQASEDNLDGASDTVEQISLIVSASPVQCVGVGEDCLQVKFSPDAEWEALQGPIDGFDYELGYRYVVLVEPAEGGKPYKLVEVQEKADMVEMDANDLAGTFWVLTSLGGLAQPDSVRSDAQFSFQYDPAENRISGRSGCNNYFGNMEVDYAHMTLTVEPMGMTRMACPEEIMAQEQAFLETLGRVASYALEDGQLFLFTDTDEVLVFAPGEPGR